LSAEAFFATLFDSSAPVLAPKQPKPGVFSFYITWNELRATTLLIGGAITIATGQQR